MWRRWRHILKAEFTILTLCLLYYLQYINSNCSMPNQPEQGRTVARKFICPHSRAGCICLHLHSNMLSVAGQRWPNGTEQNDHDTLINIGKERRATSTASTVRQENYKVWTKKETLLICAESRSKQKSYRACPVRWPCLAHLAAAEAPRGQEPISKPIGQAQTTAAQWPTLRSYVALALPA